MSPYHLTYDTLLDDLHKAYFDARRHKRNKPYQLRFEMNMEQNLQTLCKEQWERTYKAGPSTCFLVREPSLREVFAAEFRDRIVHHLYYNYTHEMFERTFIADSYSCIKGRGTHFGIDRLGKHIRKVSQNYTELCYVLKMDIKGYFMHIDRQRLLHICMESLRKMSQHRICCHKSMKWCEVVDMNFLEYLTQEIVLLDPMDRCKVNGSPKEWSNLPSSKSLFRSSEGCGLPIGNLTSQLFSNVYLNELDQYMKRTLMCRHYGRYVDDFYVVSPDREWLRGIIPTVRKWLQETLGLSLNERKIMLREARIGVEFLGAYIMPNRTYVCNKTLRRTNQKVDALGLSALRNMFEDGEPKKQMADKLQASMNSYFGVLSHHKTYSIRNRMIRRNLSMLAYGQFSSDRLRFRLFK